MLPRQPREDVVPRIGRVSEAVFVDDLLRHGAFVEIALRRVVAPSQRLMKRLGRLVHDFEQIVFVVLARRALLLRQLDADARRDMLDGLGKRESLRQREKLEDVAAGAAAEAVEKSLAAIDSERRRLLAMKRAEAFVALAGEFERRDLRR